jgi:hypothetical protein
MATAAAFLILAAATASPQAGQCPSFPGQTLAYIGIFDGPPEERADLAPDENGSQAGKAWNVWKLTPGPRGFFVNCSYGKTLEGPYSRTEVVRLPDSLTSCRAEYKVTGGATGGLSLTNFSCR